MLMIVNCIYMYCILLYLLHMQPAKARAYLHNDGVLPH